MNPFCDWSTCLRTTYLQQRQQLQQTNMPPAEFEPAILSIEPPQSYTLHRTTAAIVCKPVKLIKYTFLLHQKENRQINFKLLIIPRNTGFLIYLPTVISNFPTLICHTYGNVG
jgi:hypothetical protein